MSTITASPFVTDKAYRVTGMTCGGCANGVKARLESLPAVDDVEVSLGEQRVRLSLKQDIGVDELQLALGAGKYVISELPAPTTTTERAATGQTSVPAQPAEPAVDPLAKTFAIDGMTCGSCQAKVEQQLTALPEVASARVDLASGTAAVQLIYPTSASYLNRQLDAKYTLYDPALGNLAGARAEKGNPSTPVAPVGQAYMDQVVPDGAAQADERSWLETYRPLLTIIGLIALVTVLAQAPFSNGLDGMTWMRHFMAGFFIVFAGFKLLDVAGFGESYAMYDIVAMRWKGWGLVYPFVELGLGLAYLTNVAPFWTSIATILILGVSAIGVIQSVLNKRAIKCACLGTGFNLPMSTVTIIEDVGMIVMAVLMLMM